MLGTSAEEPGEGDKRPDEQSISKFAPKLKRHHYGQQFQNVDVVSKLTEDGGGKRGVKVLPCEIATRTGAACVSGEE